MIERINLEKKFKKMQRYMVFMSRGHICLSIQQVATMSKRQFSVSKIIYLLQTTTSVFDSKVSSQHNAIIEMAFI